MRIEPLTSDNVRGGVFCARGEAGDKMLDQHILWIRDGVLRGQVAFSDDGQPIGFILYYPIASAPLEMEGEGFYAMQCLYVRPDQGGQGVGRDLIEAAARDARAHNASGLAVEGFSFPMEESAFEFMPKSFFLAMGFQEAATQGPGTLLFLSVRADAQPPRYLAASFQLPPGADRLRIDLLNCHRCFVGIRNNDVVRRVAEEYGALVELVEHDQNQRQAVLEKGMAVGIFIEGETAFFGGPITKEQVRQEIEGRLAQRASKTPQQT